MNAQRLATLRTLLGGSCVSLLAIACSGDDPTIIDASGVGNAGQAASNGVSAGTNAGGPSNAGSPVAMGGSAGSGGSGAGVGSTTGGSATGSAGGATGSAGGATGGAGGATAAACPVHPNVTEAPGRCQISSSLAAPITTNLTLDANHVWLMTGPVIVGDDAAETVLTVEAGTTVFGNALSFILIQRGSKIVADGTAEAPIVFTSSQEVGTRGSQDWGGLVINGRAPINRPDNTPGDPGSQAGEAQTGRFGGSITDDNSGTLRYVRVEFAGRDIDPENELNGIAFQGVGSGTVVDFLQVHIVQDDGIEFFGGTVNVKHVVITGANDDNLDWTEGWVGKAQFIVAQELTASGNLSADPRGIEADNINSMTFVEEPFSDPIVSNVTLIGRAGNTNDGMRLRRGTRGEIWNTVLSGWGPCVQLTEAPTFANVTDTSLALQNLVFNCASTVGGADAALAAGTDLTDGTANVLSTPGLLTNAAGEACTAAVLGCWVPGVGSSALAIGAGPTDPFFTTVDYAGAFDGTTDWTTGWIETATR